MAPPSPPGQFTAMPSIAERLVGVQRSVGRHVALLIGLRAADVVGADLHAGNDLRQRPGIAAGRHSLEHLLAHHRLLHVRLGVDGRRSALDRNRLVERADFERHVDRRRERRADAHVGALDALESAQLELMRRRPAAGDRNGSCRCHPSFASACRRSATRRRASPSRRACRHPSYPKRRRRCGRHRPVRWRDSRRADRGGNDEAEPIEDTPGDRAPSCRARAHGLLLEARRADGRRRSP